MGVIVHADCAFGSEVWWTRVESIQCPHGRPLRYWSDLSSRLWPTHSGLLGWGKTTHTCMYTCVCIHVLVRLHMQAEILSLTCMCNFCVLPKQTSRHGGGCGLGVPCIHIKAFGLSSIPTRKVYWRLAGAKCSSLPVHVHFSMCMCIVDIHVHVCTYLLGLHNIYKKILHMYMYMYAMVHVHVYLLYRGRLWQGF